MSKKTIFIFAYYSYKDPVFQSAVLPYFENLNEEEDLEFVLLTFEKKKYKLNKQLKTEIREHLLKIHDIYWYNSTWHSGRFKLVKKAFDFLWSIILSVYLIVKYKPIAIYSEAFPGAIMGYHLSKLFGLPHLIHSFEPHTEYMVEAAVWNKNSWEAILLKKYELKIALHAKHIFTATQAMIGRLKSTGTECQIHRVPSCVDLNVFKFSELERLKIRKKLNITNEIVIVYLGKFGGMYMDKEIFDFFKVCEEFPNLNFKFIIITPDEHETVNGFIDDLGLDKNGFHIMTLERKEIFKYLSASDFGFVPVRQNPSKRFCSPIKDGEYWACGLPLLIFDGISDDFLLAEKNGIGIRIKDDTKESLEKTLEEIELWVKRNEAISIRNRCTKFAKNDRNIEVYKKLYKKIFIKL